MSTTPKIPLDFKSATLYALRAVLHSHDTDTLVAALDQRMAEAGTFYENEPVVLDASGLTQSPDWAAIDTALRRHTLHPIGVVAEGDALTQARAYGLAPVEVSASRTGGSRTRSAATSEAKDAPQTPTIASTPADIPADAPASKTSKANRKAPPADADPEAPETAQGTLEAAEAAGTMVIRHPLRSGQRIYARGGDLIVIGMVSQGAEVIADGNIHVYGPLRGKAMAGARGDTGAMILTTQLDPELLAIAGVYRVVEARLSDNLHKQAAIVQLDGDTLRIRAL